MSFDSSELGRKTMYWKRGTFEGSPTNGAEDDSDQPAPPAISPTPETYPTVEQFTIDDLEPPAP